MPYADKEKRKQYILEWKRQARRKRGLQKSGRKSYTEEQKEESKEKRKEWEKEWRKEYFEISPQKRLLWSARRRAKEKGLKFDLSEADIVIPTHCPYLGIPLVNSRPRGDSRKDIASLDRIDNNKGYTKDNIEVISWQANTMKSNASPELLLSFAEELLRRYKN